MDNLSRSHEESNLEGRNSSAQRSRNETKKQLQQIGRYQTRLIQRLLEKIMKLALFICDLDMFAIYKGNYKHSSRAKYQIYLSPMFRRRATHSDKLRDCIRRPMQMFYLYLSVKFLSLIVIQMIAHSFVMRLNKLSNHLKSQDTSELIEYYKSMIEQLYQFQDLLGNPFSIRMEFSMIILMSTLIIIFRGIFIMPYLYRIDPIDSANIRSMLDLKTEMLRIDMLIEQHIDGLLSESSNNESVSAQLQQITHMRPSTFDVKHYVRFYQLFLFHMSICFLGEAIHWTFLIVSLYLVVRDRCRLLLGTLGGACYIWTIFNWREWIAFFDITIGHILMNIEWCFLLSTMSFEFACQFFLVLGIRDDLIKCIATLQNENNRSRTNQKSSDDESDAGDRPISYHHKITLVPSLVKLDKTVSCLSASPRVCEKNVVQTLLQTYIKLVLSIEEMRRTSLFLNQVAKSFLIFAGSIALPISMIIHRGNYKTIFTQLATLIAGYCLANLIFTFGAYVYSLICKQEKMAWAILAELSIYRANHKQMNLSDADCALFDLITTKWLRYVHNQNLSTKQNTVSMFGLKVNYGTVLSLNFAILTLVSVINSFDNSGWKV